MKTIANQATTAAGIFAKVRQGMIVHGSRTGAENLAKSLADDLIANEPLR